MVIFTWNQVANWGLDTCQKPALRSQANCRSRVIMHHMFIGLGNLPAGKGGTNSATGHLDMVPYLPDFL